MVNLCEKILIGLDILEDVMKATKHLVGEAMSRSPHDVGVISQFS